MLIMRTEMYFIICQTCYSIDHMVINFSIFQLRIMARTSLFDEMIMMSALYQTNKLTETTYSARVDMLLYSVTFSCFWANHSVLFLLNAPCIARKVTDTNFIVFHWYKWFWSLKSYSTHIVKTYISCTYRTTKMFCICFSVCLKITT